MSFTKKLFFQNNLNIAIIINIIHIIIILKVQFERLQNKYFVIKNIFSLSIIYVENPIFPVQYHSRKFCVPQDSSDNKGKAYLFSHYLSK